MTDSARPAPPSSDQIELAVEEGLAQVEANAEVVLQALRMLENETPAGARGALLALETLAAGALGLSVWFCHLRGEHGRARALVDIETSVQRALSEALERRRAGEA